MKPVIIFKEKNKTGKFEFTESELKKLINDTYEDGYNDGKANNSIPHVYPNYPEAIPLTNIPNNSTKKSCFTCNWYKEMMENPGKIYVGDTPCTWCVNNNPICSTSTSDFATHSVANNKSVDFKSYINYMNAQTPGLTEDDKKC